MSEVYCSECIWIEIRHDAEEGCRCTDSANKNTRVSHTDGNWFRREINRESVTYKLSPREINANNDCEAFVKIEEE